ncbi:hypothetical protein IE81DRAFT_346647 [Ceraceosorus guamensis]|uniref:Rab-GAP TBC domain-containing protein n=1 Tax=Ceraceosorus guamensis TaxID=1522189 RepID=A0A316W0J6_9BASI|nr:hypothetical protein IE81DRAFT_346647 [Ceraceosorus guamensis]PWN43447.1 hypothetical protein IE81DRAFT_346647 [Ceraceosorus guamensis]
MDAHTLNAWTRFALQKGGIGSCTALIDNPATEAEDLMFMTGEKIIVLRRLDDDNPESSSGKRRSAFGDADAWFLGYCEGVVGRFKGGHVQFHGKLKKPVLMRRSGVGSIRESTVRPMSKSEAAALHASQVPPGIPVTAVDSDGEEASAMSHSRGGQSNVGTDGSRASTSTRGGYPTTSHGAPDKNGAVSRDLPPPQSHLRAAPAGVTTPPLSDENHARQRRTVVGYGSDNDSDESETLLPWARPMSGDSSVGSSHGQRAAGSRNNGTGVKGLGKSLEGLTTSHLPPSPISSAESPITGRGLDQPRAVGAGGVVSSAIGGSSSVEGGGGARPWDRALNGHLSNASSLDTSGTSESGEDGANRRDQTFSIYDVYGRDSVAFPNFNFTQMNGKLGSSRNLVGASRSQDSLAPRDGAPTSGGSTPEPTTPVDRRPQAPPDPTAGSAMIPANLRSPSGRRPNAAPVPAGLNLASSLRRKVEATTPISATTPMAAYPPQGPGPFSAGPQTATFDPRRRPSGPMSAGAIPTPRPRMAPQRGDSQDSSASAARSVQDGSVPPGFKPAGQPGGQQAFAQQSGVPAVGPGPPGAAQGGPQLRMQRPAGFGDTRRRSQSVSNLVVQAGLDAVPPSLPSGRSAGDSPAQGSVDLPRLSGSRGSPGFGPMRSSSDRSSMRERVGSGQLKKNPSNPGPGIHGGMAGLAPGANLAPPGASRSPSPLSAVSANSSDGRSSDARRSPNGPPANLPPFFNPNARTASLGQPPRMPDNGKPVQYDSLGFVIMDTPTRLPREDPEAVEAWQKVLAENNLEAARKSRKIKKMAQAGIPHSMRAKVWLFLANSSHRRRPGLFEQLCRQSQGAKGKKGKETAYEAIEKDLDRCYPDHKMFRGEGSTGRADLEAILKAYVHYNPIIGYTQGMGLIAGFMLLLMPAEDAFWLLCAMLRDVHMEGYYSNDMKQLHVDGIVFGQLLQSMDAPLAQRLMEMEIEPINFTPNWFLPLFSRVLPWHTLLCVWDVFFYEGPSFILRTALAVIRIVRDPLMDKRRVPGHGEGMRLLLHPPRELLTPENVVGCALTVKLKEGDMRKLQRNASKLVRQTVGRGRQSSRPGSPSARSTSAPPSKRGG